MPRHNPWLVEYAILRPDGGVAAVSSELPDELTARQFGQVVVLLSTVRGVTVRPVDSPRAAA